MKNISSFVVSFFYRKGIKRELFYDLISKFIHILCTIDCNNRIKNANYEIIKKDSFDELKKGN